MVKLLNEQDRAGTYMLSRAQSTLQQYKYAYRICNPSADVVSKDILKQDIQISLVQFASCQQLVFHVRNLSRLVSLCTCLYSCSFLFRCTSVCSPPETNT